jgi:IS5 family transposase
MVKGEAMRPRERRETGEQDLFRSRLDQIIDLTHALVKLSRAIDWPFLESQFGSVYSDGPGWPPLPTRLMAGLALCTTSAMRRSVTAGSRTLFAVLL